MCLIAVIVDVDVVVPIVVLEEPSGSQSDLTEITPITVALMGPFFSSLSLYVALDFEYLFACLLASPWPPSTWTLASLYSFTSKDSRNSSRSPYCYCWPACCDQNPWAQKNPSSLIAFNCSIITTGVLHRGWPHQTFWLIAHGNSTHWMVAPCQTTSRPWGP